MTQLHCEMVTIKDTSLSNRLSLQVSEQVRGSSEAGRQQEIRLRKLTIWLVQWWLEPDAGPNSVETHTVTKSMRKIELLSQTFQRKSLWNTRIKIIYTMEEKYINDTVSRLRRDNGDFKKNVPDLWEKRHVKIKGISQRYPPTYKTRVHMGSHI